MIYDSSLWAFEGRVIFDVANFKVEGLVTPEGKERERGISKINWSMQEIEPLSPAQKVRVLTTTLSWHVE